MLSFRAVSWSLRRAVNASRHDARLFSRSPLASAAPLPPRLKLKEEDITEAFVHGTGPGGQKINKTSCAVQLKHLPSGITTLCQETRSRSQNRKIARRILGEKVEALEKGTQSRTAIKAAIKSKKKASKMKKARRKYRDVGEDLFDNGGDEGILGDKKEEEEIQERILTEERVG